MIDGIPGSPYRIPRLLLTKEERAYRLMAYYGNLSFKQAIEAVEETDRKYSEMFRRAHEHRLEAGGYDPE